MFCRRTGRIIFFLNGVPTWRLESSAILLSNNNDDLTPRKIDALDMGTQVPTRTGLSPPNAAEDMFFTVGVVGTGEIEVNFGGKNFNLSGEISQVSKGEVESTAPIAARAFGYRLQSFHIMHVGKTVNCTLSDKSLKSPKATFRAQLSKYPAVHPCVC